MKMLLANTEEKKGNLERAAYLKRNILETRIQIFISLNQCHKVINQIENTSYVGEAWMEENGDILLQLFIDENNSMKGQTLVRYKPCTKEFNAVLQHVGELKPGKRKVYCLGLKLSNHKTKRVEMIHEIPCRRYTNRYSL